MIRILLSVVIRLLANIVGLLVAAAILDDMTVNAKGFIIAVLIFTVVEVVVEGDNTGAGRPGHRPTRRT